MDVSCRLPYPCLRGISQLDQKKKGWINRQFPSYILFVWKIQQRGLIGNYFNQLTHDDIHNRTHDTCAQRHNV